MVKNAGQPGRIAACEITAGTGPWGEQEFTTMDWFFRAHACVGFNNSDGIFKISRSGCGGEWVEYKKTGLPQFFYFRV